MQNPAVTNIVIAIATIGICLTGIQQWKTSENQWRTSEKQWKTMTEQRDAMKEQFNIMQTQLQETSDQFHASHRPWCVIPEDIKTIKPVSFESGKIKFKIGYSIKNSGNTPAFKVVTSWDIKMGTINRLAEYAQQNRDISEACKAFCVQATKILGRLIVPGDIIKVNDELSKQVDISQINTKIAILLEIVVAYRDDFDIVHYTSERWQYAGEEQEGLYYPAGEIKGHWVSYGLGGIAR